MPSILNASTSSGLVAQADTSGVLQLQTASTTALTINASQQVQVNTGGSASAPVISKSDDTNTGIFFPAADTIAFSEGGTESMRIDSAGQVGVGVTPQTWSTGKAVEIGGNGCGVWGLASGTTYVTAGYSFNSTDKFAITGSYALFSQIVPATGVFNWRASSTTGTAGNNATMETNLTLNQGGALVLKNGNASANGIGITFPATQSASSDANCLDDYEEGTWTPIATSSGGSITAYSSNGKYTKIGRVVTLFGSITVSNVGSASGPLNIAAVPFATLDSEQYSGVSREAVINGANNFVTISNTTGYIQSITGGAISWTNGSSFRFVITYQTS